MRALLLALVLLAPAVAASAGGGDAREIAANRFLDPRCPGYAHPVGAACFDTTGAAGARLELEPTITEARPLLFVQLQNDTRIHASLWACGAGDLAFGGANVTRLVIHLDDRPCGGARSGLVVHGTLTVRPLPP